MAAGAWVFTDTAKTKMLNGTFNIDGDTFKTALFLVTSDLSVASTAFSSVTNEHAAANGYNAGGEACDLGLSGTTTVKADVAVDPVYTAAGGSIIARYAAIYEVGGDVLCFCELDDTPADVTVTDGNTLTVVTDVAGVFDLS